MTESTKRKSEQKGFQFSFSKYDHYPICGFVKSANWFKIWIWKFELSYWGLSY